jgi:hypothetical protein
MFYPIKITKGKCPYCGEPLIIMGDSGDYGDYIDYHYTSPEIRIECRNEKCFFKPQSKKYVTEVYLSGLDIKDKRIVGWSQGYVSVAGYLWNLG